MTMLVLAMAGFIELSLVAAVPIDWRTARVISHSKNMGCLQSCGTDKLREAAENSVTIQSAFSPLATVNPMHVAIFLMLAIVAVIYQLLKLRKDTYRLLEESKQPATP